MKKLFLMAGFVLLTASCSNDESLDSSVNSSNEHAQAQVTVRVDGFSISQGDIPATRAEDVSTYANVKFLTLAFYKSDGTEVFKHTQERGNLEDGETFGEFSTSLMYGSYTMVVLANAGNNAITFTSLTSATYGDANPMDTWAYTQEVNITDNTAVELSAILERIVAALAVRSTDNRPAEVTHTRITYAAGGKSFNPTTGLAISNTGFSLSMAYPASSIGTTTYVGGYLFLASDEQMMDVTIETLDAEGAVLFTKTINNVPLKRNRQTTLTGAIYSGTGISASGFQVNTDWLTNHNINF